MEFELIGDKKFVTGFAHPLVFKHSWHIFGSGRHSKWYVWLQLNITTQSAALERLLLQIGQFRELLVRALPASLQNFKNI